LDSDSRVWRLAGRKNLIEKDRGKLTPEAFYRRPATADYELEKGLSVNIGAGCSVDFVKAMQFQPQPFRASGAAELIVGQIRGLEMGLDVESDEETHAEIIGVPTLEEDPQRATDIAHQLAELSSVVWVRGKGE
jgi:hypothetical protein